MIQEGSTATEGYGAREGRAVEGAAAGRRARRGSAPLLRRARGRGRARAPRRRSPPARAPGTGRGPFPSAQGALAEPGGTYGAVEPAGLGPVASIHAPGRAIAGAAPLGRGRRAAPPRKL